MKYTLAALCALLVSFPDAADAGGHGSRGHRHGPSLDSPNLNSAGVSRSDPSSGYHYVHPYTSKDGIFVKGHFETNPNGTKLDNWSTKGNVNPVTGAAGTKNP